VNEGETYNSQPSQLDGHSGEEKAETRHQIVLFGIICVVAKHRKQRFGTTTPKGTPKSSTSLKVSISAGISVSKRRQHLLEAHGC